MAKEKWKRLFCGAVIFCFFAASAMYSAKGRQVLVSTIETCAKTVIPAVFPFAVLGALIGCGVAEFPSFLKRAVSAVFGVDAVGAGALLAGLFTGFPVGASGATGLYLRGKIDKDDLCRIAAFSLTPGCTFVISGVGALMFNDIKVGVQIYLIVIISVLLVGFLTKKKKKSVEAQEKEDIIYIKETPSFVLSLTEAVSKSGSAMVTMTAFIAFFSQIAFFVSEMLSVLRVPTAASTLILGLLEVTVGCGKASALGTRAGILCAALSCAFGGLSMQMQTAAICAHCNVRILPIRIFFLRSLVALCTVLIFTLALAIGRVY